MNTFLEELMAACGTFPLREKILVGPSIMEGRQALDALAFEGGGWVNLRPSTALDLAWAAAGPSFARRGVSRITRGRAARLVEEAVRDLGARGRLRYLDRMRSPAGPAPALLDAIREMRMAGIRTSDLRPDSFVDAEKGREIRDVLVAYEAGLTAGMLADDAEACREGLKAALSGAGGGSQGEGPIYLIPQSLELEPLAFEFLNRWSDGRRIVLGCDPAIGLPEAPGPRFDLPAGRTARERGLPSPLSWLCCPDGIPRDHAGVEVRFSRAYGAANEVRHVFRRLATAGIPADAAVAVYSSGQVYIPLLLSQAAMLGVPVTFGEGVPANWTRPGRVVLALLRWVERDYPASLLNRLIMSGDIDVESPVLMARTLREAHIGWGRRRYARLRDGAGDAIRERLARMVDEILSQVPEADESGRVDMEALCLGLQDLARRSRMGGDLDRSAVEAISGTLEYCSEAAPQRLLPLDEAVSRITFEIERLRVGASRPLPGHIHVTGFGGARWDNRPEAFVLGADASSLPGEIPQDPVLLDSERRAISPHLALRSGAAARRLRSVAEALASRRGRVSLSYPSYDVAEAKPCFPSPIMLQAFRVVSHNSRAGYADLERALGDPVAYRPPAPGDAVTSGEWWLSVLHGGDPPERGLDAVRRAYPHLDAGLKADEARSGAILTVYDGLIGAWRSPPVHSASALEDLASCPFYYFLARVLGIECPCDIEYDPGRWLDAIARGQAFHEIYRRCIEEVLGRKGYELSEDRVMAITDEVVSACRDEWPVPGELVFESEVEGLRRSMAVFMRVHREMACEATPILLEVPFPDPLALPLPGGSNVLVKGRIDRIDRIEGGDGHSYAVWDYKTGKSSGYEDRGYIKRGTQIQHAVYARAAEMILRESGIDARARVESSGYLFLTEKGEGRRVARRARKWERAAEAIQRIMEIMSSGAFHATTSAERCEWCEYSPVCGGRTSAERARAKSEEEAPENEAFRPWKELQQYE